MKEHSGGSAKPGFLPEIQGLRAVALLLVLVFHLWPDTFPGGFVGVDVFFVLSGYLITRLLLKEAVSGNVDLLAFWARRIRRLLPAASVVLIVVLVLSVLLLPGTRHAEIAGDVMASAMYVVNWRFALYSVDYGHRGADPSPVQHYWSLSIEEQFYILWPLLIFLIARFAIRERIRNAIYALVITSLLVSSFGYSLFFSLSGSPSAYFVTTTRLWELGIGAAISLFRMKSWMRGWVPLILSWTGLSAIVASAFLLNTGQPFPGWIALLPVMGTVCVILGGKAGEWSPAPLLSWKPLQYLGDISYSVYLWHWPVILFLPTAISETTFTCLGHDSSLILISLGLGVISKHLIEDPFRSGALSKRIERAGAFGLAALLSGITVGASIYVLQHQKELEARALADEKNLVLQAGSYPGAAAMDSVHPVLPDRTLPVRPDPLIAKRDRPALYNDGCDLKQTDRAVPCEYGHPSPLYTVVLIGDSHAAQYLPALEPLADLHRWRIVVLEKAACLVGDTEIRFRSTGSIHTDCESWKKEAIDSVLILKPDLVITTAGLPQIYDGYYRLAPQEDLTRGYQSVWGRFVTAGIPVLVIRDNPRPLIDIPDCMAMNRLQPDRCTVSRRQVLDSLPDPLIQASQMDGVTLLDLSDYFCRGDDCPAVIGNVLVYRDGDHITAGFARTLAPFIDRKIREIWPMR